MSTNDTGAFGTAFDFPQRGMALDCTSDRIPYGIRTLDEQLEKFKLDGVAC